MKLVALGLCVVAACGFSPQAGSVDAHAGQDDAHGGIDAHVVQQSPDAKVWMDAPPVVPFDVTMCPADYTNTTITAAPNSRYKLITDAHTLAEQRATCDAGHVGWTHLFIPDTGPEAQQVTSHMTTVFYVGVVQPQNQAGVATGWLTVAGDPVPSAAWGTGQPNDNADGVENNEQNFAIVEYSNGTMNDVNSTFLYTAVCECDGKPVPPAIAALFP